MVLAMNPENLADWTHTLQRSVLRELVAVAAQPGVLSFAGGLPATELFPAADYAEALSTVLAEDPRAMQYSPPYAPLKNHIIKLMTERGIPDCPPGNFFLTTGAQQALNILARLLLNPENPRVIGPAIADAVTGFYAAYGVLGALVERGRTGEGRKVEVSMLEAMCHFNLDSFTHYYSVGEVMDPYSRPKVSQSYAMECSDGEWIALHLSSPEKFWSGLAAAIEKPKLFDDPRFADRAARIEHQRELIELMQPIFKTRKRSEWCVRLEERGVPFSPIYKSSEALEDPQARHLQLLVEATHPTLGAFRTVRPPVSFDGERSLEVRPPPTLGEHNEEIRAELERRKPKLAADG